jgi:DNA-binding transcriptional MerR regulator
MRYTVGAAARAAGVTEGRLRTWERRYGIPSPARSATGRRLYTEAEVSTIRRMAALTASGIPAAQAAEAARQEQSALPPAALAGGEAGAALAGQLATLAERLEPGEAALAIRSAVQELGWAGALSQVIFPALSDVGRRWQAGTLTAAHEHFLAEIVRMELLAALASRPRLAADAPLALLACPEDERHDLGLLALRLLLAARGVRVLYLGQDLPRDALLSAVRDARPAAVCLAATVPASAPALRHAAQALAATSPGTLLFVGGPGLSGETDGNLPGIRLAGHLGEAAGQVAAMVLRPKGGAGNA